MERIGNYIVDSKKSVVEIRPSGNVVLSGCAHQSVIVEYLIDDITVTLPKAEDGIGDFVSIILFSVATGKAITIKSRKNELVTVSDSLSTDQDAYIYTSNGFGWLRTV